MSLRDSEFLSLATHAQSREDATLPDLMHPWYAIRVRSSFEQSVSDILKAKDYEEFTPFYRANRYWSDRTKLIDFPLFPGYVFARFDVAKHRPILQIPGVVSVVAFGNEFISIDEKEIEAIRKIWISGNQVAPWPYLRTGQRVRIRSGTLKGIEGLLVGLESSARLIVSLTLLQRSIAVEIERDSVESIL